MNMYTGSLFLATFFGNCDDNDDSTCLSHGTGLDEPRDRRDDDLANSESEPSASNAEVTLFL